MNDKKRVALITGAARGIGASMARAFAVAGYHVVALDVQDEELTAVADGIVEDGGSCIAVAIDLSDISRLESFVNTIGKDRGRIDVLVNNAATRTMQSVRHLTLAEWNHVLAVNLTAPAFLTGFVAPYMQRTDSRPAGGAIINITSVEANIPKGVAASYAAAKGGLLSLTYESAASLACLGIRVVALSPGAIDTEFGGDYETVPGEAAGELNRAMRHESEQVIPMRRWGTTDEVADAAIWIASEGASYLTGCEIKVDGGLTHTWMPHSIKRQILPGEFEADNDAGRPKAG